MCVVVGLERQRQLGERGHLDQPVGRPVVDDGDAARLAVAFRDDDALDLGPQRPHRLDEGRLVVAKQRFGELFGRPGTAVADHSLVEVSRTKM